jgi:hypothetical protein
MTARAPCRPYPRPDPRAGQRGVTLLEAVIYAALSLLLIGLAMGGLGTVQRGLSRTNEMARMRGDADEAMQIMGREIRNLGLKRLFYRRGNGAFADTLLAGASYAPGDSSSFRHRDGARYDALTFLSPVLDGRGAPLGVDTVTYSVDSASQTLQRSVNGRAPMALCRRVEALQFEYGISARARLLVDERTPVQARWTGFPAANLRFAGPTLMLEKQTTAHGTVSAWQIASAFSTSSDRRYAFDLSGAVDDAFLANVDSLVAMLCTPAGTVVASERFLLGAVSGTLRVEFAAPACGDCRAGVRATLRGRGRLMLTAFAFSEIARSDMAWSPDPAPADKPGVRAVRIRLLVGSDMPVSGIRAGGMRLANAELAFNDRKGRSLLDEIIPTPNNGL